MLNGAQKRVLDNLRKNGDCEATSGQEDEDEEDGESEAMLLEQLLADEPQEPVETVIQQPPAPAPAPICRCMQEPVFKVPHVPANDANDRKTIAAESPKQELPDFLRELELQPVPVMAVPARKRRDDDDDVKDILQAIHHSVIEHPVAISPLPSSPKTVANSTRQNKSVPTKAQIKPCYSQPTSPLPDHVPTTKPSSLKESLVCRMELKQTLIQLPLDPAFMEKPMLNHSQPSGPVQDQAVPSQSNCNASLADHDNNARTLLEDPALNKLQMRIKEEEEIKPAEVKCKFPALPRCAFNWMGKKMPIAEKLHEQFGVMVVPGRRIRARFRRLATLAKHGKCPGMISMPLVKMVSNFAEAERRTCLVSAEEIAGAEDVDVVAAHKNDARKGCDNKSKARRQSHLFGGSSSSSDGEGQEDAPAKVNAETRKPSHLINSCKTLRGSFSEEGDAINAVPLCSSSSSSELEELAERRKTVKASAAAAAAAKRAEHSVGKLSGRAAEKKVSGSSRKKSSLSRIKSSALVDTDSSSEVDEEVEGASVKCSRAAKRVTKAADAERSGQRRPPPPLKVTCDSLRNISTEKSLSSTTKAAFVRPRSNSSSQQEDDEVPQEAEERSVAQATHPRLPPTTSCKSMLQAARKTPVVIRPVSIGTVKNLVGVNNAKDCMALSRKPISKANCEPAVVGNSAVPFKKSLSLKSNCDPVANGTASIPEPGPIKRLSSFKPAFQPTVSSAAADHNALARKTVAPKVLAEPLPIETASPSPSSVKKRVAHGSNKAEAVVAAGEKRKHSVDVAPHAAAAAEMQCSPTKKLRTVHDSTAKRAATPPNVLAADLNDYSPQSPGFSDDVPDVAEDPQVIRIPTSPLKSNLSHSKRNHALETMDTAPADDRHQQADSAVVDSQRNSNDDRCSSVGQSDSVISETGPVGEHCALKIITGNLQCGDDRFTELTGYARKSKYCQVFFCICKY